MRLVLVPGSVHPSASGPRARLCTSISIVVPLVLVPGSTSFSILLPLVLGPGSVHPSPSLCFWSSCLALYILLHPCASGPRAWLCTSFSILLPLVLGSSSAHPSPSFCLWPSCLALYILLHPSASVPRARLCTSFSILVLLVLVPGSVHPSPSLCFWSSCLALYILLHPSASGPRSRLCTSFSILVPLVLVPGSLYCMVFLFHFIFNVWSDTRLRSYIQHTSTGHLVFMVFQNFIIILVVHAMMPFLSFQLTETSSYVAHRPQSCCNAHLSDGGYYLKHLRVSQGECVWFSDLSLLPYDQEPTLKILFYMLHVATPLLPEIIVFHVIL
ncbi:uncharacterized protein LOC125717641 isoform X2 [Brienomyrus brachyistius]|uniref:uncharacterized protein LOC125717641 isoform X2 n=1 Tax=Brienomyrus brachyistius TaxID=42636 RepID=UPI0020B28F57|nr:uncharacterized protein LOC125717641 isoform X2 [Brienomyrus brachyistius]